MVSPVGARCARLTADDHVAEHMGAVVHSLASSTDPQGAVNGTQPCTQRTCYSPASIGGRQVTPIALRAAALNHRATCMTRRKSPVRARESNQAGQTPVVRERIGLVRMAANTAHVSLVRESHLQRVSIFYQFNRLGVSLKHHRRDRPEAARITTKN
jgi:hypothetical protein